VKLLLQNMLCCLVDRALWFCAVLYFIQTSVQHRADKLCGVLCLAVQEEEGSADGTGYLLVDKLSDLQLEG
jgi:hypothetical protein